MVAQLAAAVSFGARFHPGISVVLLELPARFIGAGGLGENPLADLLLGGQGFLQWVRIRRPRRKQEEADGGERCPKMDAA